MRNACPQGAACRLALLLTVAPVTAQETLSVAAARTFLRRLHPTPIDELRLDRWIGDLGSERFAVRENAERALAAFGGGARSALAEASRSGSPEVRDRAERILAALTDAAFERRLHAAFVALGESGEPGVAAAIVDALGACSTLALRECAVRQLAAAARPEDDALLRAALVAAVAETREIVVRVLAERPDLGLDVALRARLRDVAENVRLEAARALVMRGDRTALPVLVDLLAATDVHVRARAHSVLCAATRRPSSFVAWDAVARRRPSIDAWRRWLQTAAPTAKLWLPLEPDPRNSPVSGFLLSVSGKSVRLFGRDGALRWEMPADPYDAQIAGGRIVITERSSGVVRVVDQDRRTLCRIAGLSTPVDADLLPNGNLLVLENSRGRVLEYAPNGRVAWQAAGLNNPFDAVRLPDGNTLVADSGAGRLVEIDRTGREVWVVAELAFPNGVVRLASGETVYTTYTTGSVVMLDPAGRKLWETVIPKATLYSPDVAEGRIWVADSVGQQVVVLDMAGRELSRIALPESFTDVSYAR